ncbi:hypothetical protein Misp01_26580 [Microtetraspora sp. NBRC 13810]|uniref:hypothetical protein n=1 Tax=Microtetraspora sp. NBRC 13810 TaxID=3030990 RepID=UPI0024A18FFE|nr:hypothetical protein [Microtetraspora sp. NBRC 13810]GLW07528.1 hypothetical protein Misp01_26580 [Microtetraspora sp. NBRC 13810]
MATPLLLVIVLVAAVGAGVVGWQWVSSPVTAGLLLAAGDGGSGDEAFAVPAGGAGSNQVLNAVASAGDTIVAVGSDTTSPVPRPLFLTSADNGGTWRLGDVTGQGGPVAGPSTVGRVAGGEGRWVAVENGEAATATRGVWTSTDGHAWSAVPASGLTAFRREDRVHDIARTGTGFVAVGSTTLGDGTVGPMAWVSPDGTSWTRLESRNIGTPDKLRGINTVIARQDAVVALADPPAGTSSSVVLRSPDGGRNWLRTGAELAGVMPRPGALAVVPDGFVLVPARQRTDEGEVRVFCSPEGAEWSRCGSIKGLPRDSTGVTGLASSAAGLAAVAETGWDRYAVYTSGDGRSWTKGTDLGAVPGTVRALAVSDSGTLVVGGDRRATDVDNQLVLMTAPRGRAATPVRLGDIEGLTRVARETTRITAADGRYVAVGAAAGDAGIWTSGDGQSWAAAGGGALGGPNKQTLSDVAYGRAGWLAVGGAMRDAYSSEPLLATSGDGESWNRVPVADALAPAQGHYFLVPHAVAAGRSGYVVAGEDRDQGGAVPAIWFSADLRRFTRAAKLPSGGTGVRVHDVAATGLGYVAVGGSSTSGHESGVVWVSKDGLNWTARKRVTPPGVSEAGLRHVVAVQDRIIAVGAAVDENGGRRAFSAVSEDNGETWEFGRLPAEQAAAVQDLAATPEGMVAVGWHGAPAESDSAAWTSEDGLDWQRQTFDQDGLSGAGAQWLGAVAISGGEVVSTGRSTGYSVDHLTLWRTTFRR